MPFSIGSENEGLASMIAALEIVSSPSSACADFGPNFAHRIADVVCVPAAVKIFIRSALAGGRNPWLLLATWVLNLRHSSPVSPSAISQAISFNNWGLKPALNMINNKSWTSAGTTPLPSRLSGWLPTISTSYHWLSFDRPARRSKSRIWYCMASTPPTSLPLSIWLHMSLMIGAISLAISFLVASFLNDGNSILCVDNISRFDQREWTRARVNWTSARFTSSRVQSREIYKHSWWHFDYDTSISRTKCESLALSASSKT